MALYMIGIGLWDASDITLKGLELIKDCDFVYLENYTSRLNPPIEELEKLYCQKIIPADRDMVENRTEQIISSAENLNVAFLVMGDPFGATTHSTILLAARKKGIPVKIIHNASIISAIGEIGLELYKFGRITSIPFDNKDVTSPYDALQKNQSMGLHTLFLLDLNTPEEKYMTVAEAVQFLIRLGLQKDQLCIGCAGIGSPASEFKAGPAGEILTASFSLSPQCLVIPGKLHFMEEEAMNSLVLT